MRFITLPRTVVLLIALALTLLPSSVGQAAPPGPDAVRTTHTLDIRAPVPPICAGQDYSVLVYALEVVETADDHGRFPGTNVPVNSGLPGGAYRSERRLLGIKIEALAQDPSVAALSPKYLITGWDVQAAPNVAAFSLHANKPGKTNLYFEALLNGQYFGPGVPIEVVPCQYKVSMVYVGKAVSSAVVYKMATVELTGNGVDFTGTGPVKWHYTIIQPPCRLTSTTPDTQATITGHVDSDQKKLTLNFKFSTATTHGTVSCFGRSGSTDAPWDFGALFSTATFPESGGTRAYPVGTGRVVVSVVPSTGATP